jgi:hypothetical protein
MGTFAKDDYASGSRAALMGGTTTLIEMCCPSRAEDPVAPRIAQGDLHKRQRNVELGGIIEAVAVADARIERTVPLVFSMSGETFDVGIDTGAPVGPYPHEFACTAHIHGVTLERLSEPPPHIAARIAAGELAAGLAAH